MPTNAGTTDRKTPMNLLKFFVLLILLFFAGVTWAQTNRQAPSGPPGGNQGWSTFFRGGYVHQFDADIDNGGSFDVNRWVIQGGVGYTTTNQTNIRLALGYGFDGYNFSGSRGLGGLDPWEDIHSWRISVPIRWRFKERWSAFVMPTLRWAGENGASAGDSFFGGGIVGFAYRLSDRLTLGPGLGVFSQIEDNASVFPILIIDWKITDTLSFGIGSGLGATQGPGLALNWRPLEKWTFSLGGRYEKQRFRLDDSGVAPGGVGEERSFPIFLSANYRFNRHLQASAVGGVGLAGRLSLEDKNGRGIRKEDHDPAGFLGVTLRFRF
jgi:hypothetical protein